jgi:hypothetical protein
MDSVEEELPSRASANIWWEPYRVVGALAGHRGSTRAWIMPRSVLWGSWNESPIGELATEVDQEVPTDALRHRVPDHTGNPSR